VVLLLVPGVTDHKLALLMFVFGAFVVGTIAQEFYRGVRARTRMANEVPPVALVHLVRRNRRRYGGYIVHLGVALALIGIAGALAAGQTVLENCAREPEILAMQDALNAMGAKVQGAGTSIITIDGVSSLHAADELEFLEIFVNAPLELCEQRDPKGLYARARAGELTGLTGVGAPYEAPADPDLVLGTLDETVERGVERVFELLAARGLLSS